MFDNINVSPEWIEFAISYVIPGAIMVLVVVLTALKMGKEVKSFRDFWRDSLFPLVNEETDPTIIVAAMLLHMSPDKLVAALKKVDDAIDPKEAARLIIDSINSQRKPARETIKQIHIGG